MEASGLVLKVSLGDKKNIKMCISLQNTKNYKRNY